MHFEIKTGAKPHPKPSDLGYASKHELKTWLYENYQDYNDGCSTAEAPNTIEQITSPESSSNTPRSSRMSTASSTYDSYSSVEYYFVVIKEVAKRSLTRSRLCPFPLLINVVEKEQMREIASTIRSSKEYEQMIKVLKRNSSKKTYSIIKKGIMAERMVKVLNKIQEKTNPDNTSHQFVNLKVKRVKFDDDVANGYTENDHDKKKPNIILVPKNIPESQLNLWKNVTTAIKFRSQSSEDLSTELLWRISQYALAMICRRTFSAVTYIMTITGNIARIYRYDAQKFYITEGAIITDPDGFETFCKYIAFMAHPDRQKECFKLGNEFQVQCLDKTIRTYRSHDEDFKIIFNRRSLFGSRTVCYSGLAHEIYESRSQSPPGEEECKGSNTENLKEPIRIVIKLTWVAPKLQSHELNVLHHLHNNEEFSRSSSRFKVPRPLGTLFQIDENFQTACHISNSQSRLETSQSQGDEEKPVVQFDSLITECPKGDMIEESRVLETITVFKNLAKVLLDISKTGVHYRDLNLGNILQTGEGDTSDCFLIDFGNARIKNQPRGQSHPGTTFEIALDDYESCTEIFASIASMKLDDLTDELSRFQSDCEDERISPRGKSRTEALIKEFESKLPRKIHIFFDDLQASFFCFLYTLGMISRRTKEFPKDLTKKEAFFRFSVFVGYRLFSFENPDQEVIDSMMSDLYDIIHPNNRKKVVEQLEIANATSSDTFSPNELEEKYVEDWIHVCEKAIISLKNIRESTK